MSGQGKEEHCAEETSYHSKTHCFGVCKIAKEPVQTVLDYAYKGVSNNQGP